MIRGLRTDIDVIELVGESARRFANGQFTNNVRDLPVGAHQHTAMTDDRGRLFGLGSLWVRAEDRIVLALEGWSADDFEERYRMLLLLDEVEVVRHDGPVHTIQGGRPHSDGLWWPAPRSPAGGIDVVGELPPSLLDATREAEPEELEALRIAEGWPRWPVDASERQLPHELGLRSTHLHFEKGCYRGQEIIHRIDVMGGVRKALTGVQLSGTPDTDELRNGSKKVGRLGSRVEHPELGWIGLAVVRNEHRDPGTVLTLGEVTATVCSLPIA